jgi:polyhydroxyalkanoate synthase
MKYYILDLSAQNSLVRYLVEHGHTVFMISWKNPTAADRDWGLDDYLQLGFREAFHALGAIVPDRKVHAVGYRIGGTLFTIAAAAVRGAAEPQLASLSLLASLVDFSEPGELSVFISPSQVAMLEGAMHGTGVLSSDRMAAAFTLLRNEGSAVRARNRHLRTRCSSGAHRADALERRRHPHASSHAQRVSQSTLPEKTSSRAVSSR